MLMSWEDWLTLCFAVITFVSVAVSIQRAHWIEDMPPLVPTALAALVIGLVAARIRAPGLLILPVVLLLGAAVVVLASQPYAEGVTLAERFSDFRFRMAEWWQVVWAGDISNDNLPFVTSVQTVTFAYCLLAAWSIYRWRNAWVAIIPAGFVLLSNISFMKGHPSGAFVAYLFGSLLLVSRLHLQASQARWQRDRTSYPDWVSLNALNVSTVVAVGLILAAWMIPLGTQAAAAEALVSRVVKPVEGETDHFFRLFHNIDSRKGARLHTFGDTLPIQGDVTLGSKVLFEVRATDVSLLRGASYNEYTGNGWKATDRGRERVDGSDIAAAESYLSQAVSTVSVRVIDRESTVLPPGIPLGSNIATYVQTPDGFGGDIERMDSRRALGDGDSYNSVGAESRATAAELRAAGTDYPDWVVARYLQLPDSLPARVGEEAARITAGASSPYDQAITLEEYLRDLPFDPTVATPPPGSDAVDFLLFELHRGYFDYQATALAVMLRTLGVPSRVAVGYVLDPTDANGSVYTVRKDDAYSWVEVFFPDYGWVAFNPTRNRPAGGAGGIGTFIPDSSGDSLTPDELADILADPGAPFPDIADALVEPPTIADPGRTIPWLVVLSAAAAMAVVAALAFAGRIAWNWNLGGLDQTSSRWEKTQKLAGYAGFPSRHYETPAEWAARLGSGIEMEPEATALRHAYETSRYGGPDGTATDEETTESSYRAIRNRLLGRIFRRGGRAGR